MNDAAHLSKRNGAAGHFLSTPLDDLLKPGESGDGFGDALALLRAVSEGVPAYRAVLKEQGIDPLDISTPADYARLPLLDKANYIRRFSLDDLVIGGSLARCDFFAVSSGSTGEPTFWPRATHDEWPIAARFEQVLRDAFQAHRKRTLAVVCFALGSWVGGMFTTSCLRCISQKGYPLLTVTPGNKVDEILRVVQRLAPQFEQTILLGYPPFLKEVIDAGLAQGGAQGGLDWGKFDVKLVMAGEVFSETWRELVAERVGATDLLRFSASLYGTADAGVLGQETPLSIAIRRFLAGKPEAAKALFGDERLPTLCQYDPTARYFEVHEGTLLFSGDNGVPLVRYHIADRGGIMGFDRMMEALRGFGFDPGQALQGGEPPRHQPFVWVFGRANFTVSFFGANVYPENVSLGLEQPEIRGQVTGKFVMEVKEGLDSAPRLTIAVELAKGVAAEKVGRGAIEKAILAQLKRLNSEFANYVPTNFQQPVVTLYPTGHPDYFPVGVKHRYSR